MFILNRNEEIVAILSGNADDSACHFFNSNLTLEINKGASLTFEVDTTEADIVQYIKEENMVVVHDGENYRLLIIKEISDVHEGEYIKEVYCEDASAELIDEIIYDEIEGKIEMGDVLATILKGTRWQVGEVDNTYIRNLKPEFKLKSVLNGIQNLASQYGAEIDFTVEFAGNKITSRKVHMKKAFGRTLGKRFEFGKDVTSIKRTVNTADIKTAIVPFGATDEETGEVLTIREIEWIKPNNPYNKPFGQTFLEDEEATELWGYKGTGSKRRARWVAVTFEDCNDAHELINYAQLQLNRFNKPKVSYEASVVDLFRMTGDDSYSFEKVGLGDMVNIIDHEFVPALALTSRVVKLELDLNDTSNSKVTLGTVIESIVDKDIKTQIEELNVKVSAVASNVDLSDIEDRLDILESETGTGRWEQIQEVNNLLFGNSVGYHYMGEDNGIWVFDKPVNQNPTKAVALKGGMIGLAKYDEQQQKWNVGTFIDGNQVNASMITTGTLKADRIEAGALTVNHFNQELKTIINSVGDKPSREEVTTSIQTAVDNITLSVKNTYATKSEAESMKTSAVTESKKYSDIKKEEAISEAVTDANEYSDAKKDEAVAEAGKDAQAKADAVKTTLTKQIDLKASKTDVYTKTETYSKAETDAKIKVAKESIELSVSGTYETKSNVENKITSAKSEAILSAVETSTSYADTKKEEAVAEAVESSNDYADAKKTEAINTSKNYADTKKTEAVADAKGYADTKKAEAIAQAGKDADGKVATVKTDLQKNIDLKASKTDVYTKTETYSKAETDSAIKVAKDSIELGVSNKYETKTNVESKITSAKTEVKGYADVKKTEAITQAGKDATNKVNSAKTELNGKIDLKASKTDVYTKSETYTKGETDSAIKVAKDEINLGVSNTYETKTNVESKVKGAITSLQVGGDNVLRNGNFANGLSNWSTHDMSSGGTNKSISIVTGGDWVPSDKKVLQIKGTNTTDRYGVISSAMKLIPNTKYTISGYCAGHRVGRIQVNVRDLDNASANIHSIHPTLVAGGTTLNKWTRFETTFTTSSNSSFALNLYSINFADNGYVWFCDVQVQQGTKATAWTPCLQDINASIGTKANASDVYTKSEIYTKSETDSKINVAKDSITSSVSATYETKTNVTTKVNDAISGIKIGARNLLLSSNIEQGNLSGNNGDIIAGASNFFRVKNRISAKAGEKYALRINKPSGSSCVIEKIIAFNTNGAYLSTHLVNSRETIFTAPTNCTGFKIVFIIDNATASSLLKTFEIMLENGTKYSDYTPAPEDLEKTIELVERRVETAEQKITPTAIINTVSQQLGADGKLQNSIMKFDKNGLEVTHSEANTRTQMNSKGFFIYNSQGETVGSLATETGLSIVNANKVYADNIALIYEGDSNLYVNHNHTGSNQGTSENPFRSFADLKRHLESQPIINKNLSIYIQSTGGDITEQLYLTGLTGSGLIWIYYDKACVHRQSAAGQFAIVLDNITNYIGIEGNRSNYNSNDGAIICDGWNAHGISITNCSNVFVGSINIHCQNWGIKVYRSKIKTRRVDFCGTWCCLDLSQLSHGTDSDSCGGSSNGEFFRLYDGSIFLYGDSGGGYRPVGRKDETSGKCFLMGNERTATASFRTPPPAPTTSDQYGTWSMRDYGYFTYGRNGINVNRWNPSTKRIQQGEWSGYGNNYGFAFFDDSNIRSWLANGTPKDGSTITLKRASSGGYSSSQPVYLCGATNTSCSGTPSGVKSYGNIGSLAWGETKTFNIPTSFVNDLKSGTIKSVCFYDSSGASYVKIESVSIKLKANKPV